MRRVTKCKAAGGLDPLSTPPQCQVAPPFSVASERVLPSTRTSAYATFRDQPSIANGMAALACASERSAVIVLTTVIRRVLVKAPAAFRVVPPVEELAAAPRSVIPNSANPAMTFDHLRRIPSVPPCGYNAGQPFPVTPVTRRECDPSRRYVRARPADSLRCVSRHVTNPGG